MFKLSPEFPDVYKAPEWAGKKLQWFSAPPAAGLSLSKHVGTRVHSQEHTEFHYIHTPQNLITDLLLLLWFCFHNTNTRCKQIRTPTAPALSLRGNSGLQKHKQRQKSYKTASGKEKTKPVIKLCTHGEFCCKSNQCPIIPVQAPHAHTGNGRKLGESLREIHKWEKTVQFALIQTQILLKTLHTHKTSHSLPQGLTYIPGRVLREKRVCETHTGTLIHHSGSTSSTLLTDTVLLLLGRNPARHLHSNSLTISSEWSSPLQEHPQFLSSDFFFFFLVFTVSINKSRIQAPFSTVN